MIRGLVEPPILRVLFRTLTQTSASASAIVYATGFNTSRGTLIRSILYPKPHDIKFQRDGAFVILVMVIWAVLGFIFSIVVLHFGCLEPSAQVINALDLITIAIPPGLPMALAIGVVWAQRRLIKKERRRINCKNIFLK